MTKEELIKSFNPNGVGVKNGNFIGLPFEEEHADLIIQPAPWDVTVSYGAGTSDGPTNILEASVQLDLYDADYPDFWKQGIYFRPVSMDMLSLCQKLRPLAEAHIDFLESGGQLEKHTEAKDRLNQINAGNKEFQSYIYKNTKALLNQGKKVVLCGGSHSTPLGYYQSLAERYDTFGILQFDAHMDLRKAYEGFELSHASIMYNALQLKQITKLVQVGIRDFCNEELELVENQNERIKVFYDASIRRALYRGEQFKDIVQSIINELPSHVYISFDIDALNPSLCPNTGTPVAGGLEIQEAFYILYKLKKSGRTIIGADLNEVAGRPNEWDGNVGARVLYKLLGVLSN